MNLRTEVVTNSKITHKKMDFCFLVGIYHIYLTSPVIKAEGIIREEGSEFLCYRICGFPRNLFTMTEEWFFGGSFKIVLELGTSHLF